MTAQVNNIKGIQALIKSAGLSGNGEDILKTAQYLNLDITEKLGTTDRKRIADAIISGRTAPANVTLEGSGNLATVQNTGITPAIKNALSQIPVTNESALAKANDFVESFISAGTSELDTIIGILKTVSSDNAEVTQEMLAAIGYVTHQMKQNESQVISALDTLLAQQSRGLSDLQDTLAKAQQMREQSRQRRAQASRSEE